MRRLIPPLCAGLLFIALPARADDRRACVEAADSGQTLRDQGKLVLARESFVTCARDVCPAVVANQCTTWLTDVSREIATLTFRATDASGKDLIDVQVWVDGVLKVASIDGRTLPIDPGVHRIRFAHVGDQDVEQEVVIHAGEKVRTVEARMGARSAPGPASDTERPKGSGFRFPLLSAVSLGVGVASFIGMGVLVGTTSSDVDHLRATCAGNCNPSDVSSANTRIAVANVAMGLGILGVGTAAISLLVVNVGHKDGGASQAILLRGGAGSLEITGAF